MGRGHDHLGHTQPAHDGSTILAQQVIDNYGVETAEWYEFDVGGYVEQQKALGKTAVSFMLKAEGSSTALVIFNSKEASANGDHLRIESLNPGTTANEPLADGYVRGGTYANDEFGTYTAMEIKDDANASNSFDRESYLKFDIGTGEIAGATLRVYGSLTDPTSTTIGAFAVANTTWSESTINWSNKPVPTGTALATTIVTGETAQWYEFDLTAHAQAERAAGRSTISLLLKSTNGATRANFNSREAAVNRPQLIVEPEAAQPPAAPTGLTAEEAGTDAIEVSWTDQATNETGFEVQISPDGTSGWATVATPGVDATSTTVDELLPATTYHFRVRAINANGASAWVGPVSTTTARSSPM
ncbi:MAG: DNRLRE domain-containing protein [Tepidisphaeraceae bacterium]